MSRRNKFLEQESIISDKVNNLEKEGNYVEMVVDHINEKAKEDAENTIQHCSPDKFKPYDNDKIRLTLHTGEERDRLKESIEKNGIMIPVICTEDMMILAGHNRVDVAKELGIEVPYIIKEGLSQEEKDLICIDTNLLNRQITEYKISQLAYILKVKMDAEKHQGISSHGIAKNETSSTEWTNSSSSTSSTEWTKRTGDKIGEDYKLSKSQVAKYIRMNNLIDDALYLVDEKMVSLNFGYELSFLESTVQEMVLRYRDTYTITEKVIKGLRNRISEEENVDDNFIKSTLFDLCSSKTQAHKLDYRNIKKYIPDSIKPNDVETYVIKALKEYAENHKEN